MSSLPVDVNTLLQGSEATFIPDEGIHVIYPQVADAAAQLRAMRVVCYRLLQILDTPYNVSNAAHFGVHQTLRDSGTFPQLELARVACCQLLQVLESPYNVLNVAPIGESQVFETSGIYPQVTLTPTQLESVWDTYYQLLHIYGSLHDGSNAAQFEWHQVPQGSGIPQIYQVTLAAAHLKFVLVACDQLLQVYGMLPGEYNATQLGEHQVLVDNAFPIHPPVPEAAQPTNFQEVRVPAAGDTSGRSHCRYGDCKATFGRPQERKRHLTDVHTLRRQCPFCPYEWARPDKIRAHLMKNHHDELPQEALNEIRAKRGQHLVAFLTPLCNISEGSPSASESESGSKRSPVQKGRQTVGGKS